MKGLLFIVFQCLGAFVGALILHAVLPVTVRGAPGLGCTGVNPKISVGQVSIWIETELTFNIQCF